MQKDVSRLLLLPLLLLPASALYAAYATPLAEEELPFSAVLRIDDRAPVLIDAPLMPGDMESINLEDAYVLEISAPEDDLAQGSARLLRPEGDTMLPLHTLRQPWRGEGWPVLGYRICEGQVSFFPLARDADADDLPTCPNQLAGGR